VRTAIGRRIRIVQVTTLAVGIVFAARAARPHPLAAGAEYICTPSNDDVSKWHLVEMASASIRVPTGYGVSGSGGTYQFYASAGRYIGIQIGEYGVLPTGQQQGNTQTQSVCETVLGGRPAEISIYTWDHIDRAMAPSGEQGTHWVALARWAAYEGLPTTYVWIASHNRADLMALRQVFFTARFKGIAPDSASLAEDKCARMIHPLGAATDFVDTGLVSMLASSSTPPLPKGSAIFEITFDSSGVPGLVDVAASDLPAAAQRQLAAIVGSNIKQQSPLAERAGLRVEIGATGVTYVLVPVKACAAR
jgi:hypothetical protein